MGGGLPAFESGGLEGDACGIGDHGGIYKREGELGLRDRPEGIEMGDE
jgi:hypothetical protein